MAEDNKEKDIDEELDLTSENKEEEVKANLGDDWVWDASTPETNVDDLTFDELTVKKDPDAEKAYEEKAEEDNQENEEETYKDPDDDGTCIVCGKPRGNSPSDLYCESCRSKFLKTNYGVGHIIVAFVMAIIVVISYVVSVITGQMAMQIHKSEVAIKDNNFNDISLNYTGLSDIASGANDFVNGLFKSINPTHISKDVFVVGKRMNKIEAKAMLRTLTILDYSDFIKAIDTLVDEKQLNSADYADIKAGYDYCKSLDAVASSVAQKWQEYIQGDGTDENYKIPYEETLKYLDTYKAENDAQRSYINFYKALTAYNAKKDAKTTVGFFDDAYQLAGDYSYTYLSTYMALTYELKDYDQLLSICNIAIQNDPTSTTAYNFATKVYVSKGDFAKANEMCSKLEKYDTDKIDYYSMKAEVLRREGKFDETINLCDKAIKEQIEVSEIYRQKAIACYLKKDTKNALEAVKKTYDISVQNAYSGNTDTLIADMNTVALIASLAKDKEKYDEAIDILGQVQAKELEVVTKCIKGETTFEEIFMKGVGDIQ